MLAVLLTVSYQPG